METSTGELVGDLLRKAQAFDAWHEEAATRLQRQASRLHEQAGRLIQVQAGVAAELARQGEQLAEETAVRKELLAEADALRATLAELEALPEKLKERDAHLAELEIAAGLVDGLRGRIAELELAESRLAEALERADKLDAAESALAEKDRRIAALESVEAQLKEALERAAQLGAAQAALAEKDLRIAELEFVEAQLEEALGRAAQLDATQAALAEKDQRIAALESVETQLRDALERAALLDAAEAALAERDRLILEYSERMDRLAAEADAHHGRAEAAEEERSGAELEKKMLLSQIEGLEMKVSEAAGLRARIAKLETELEGERARALRTLGIRAQTNETAERRAKPVGDSFLEGPIPMSPPVPQREKAQAQHDVAPVVSSTRGRKPRRQMGEILVEAEIMTQEQFDESIRMQAADPHKRIGQIVVELGYATEEVIAATLAAQLHMRFAEDIEREMTAEAMRMVPQNMAINHRCVPLAYDGGQLTVAMVNPLDLIAIEDLQHATGAYIEVVVATPRAIERVIDKYYMKASVK